MISYRLQIPGLQCALKNVDSIIIVQETHVPKLMVINWYYLDIFLSLIYSAWRRVDCFKLMQWDNYLFKWRQSKNQQTLVVVNTPKNELYLWPFRNLHYGINIYISCNMDAIIKQESHCINRETESRKLLPKGAESSLVKETPENNHT